jgi:hypothetical protein
VALHQRENPLLFRDTLILLLATEKMGYKELISKLASYPNREFHPSFGESPQQYFDTEF